MTTLILTILIILCVTSFIEVYLIVNYLGVKITFDVKKRGEEQAPAPSIPMTPEDEERVKEMRRRSEEELKAFQDIMNYNANVAYGINKRAIDVYEE